MTSPSITYDSRGRSEQRAWAERGYAEGRAGKPKRDRSEVPDGCWSIYANRYRIGSHEAAQSGSEEQHG